MVQNFFFAARDRRGMKAKQLVRSCCAKKAQGEWCHSMLRLSNQSFSFATPEYAPRATRGSVCFWTDFNGKKKKKLFFSNQGRASKRALANCWNLGPTSIWTPFTCILDAHELKTQRSPVLPYFQFPGGGEIMGGETWNMSARSATRRLSPASLITRQDKPLIHIPSPSPPYSVLLFSPSRPGSIVKSPIHFGTPVENQVPLSQSR